MTDDHLNALPKGHRLQEYELMRVLGHGGFGITYLGYDHNLDKAVAVKEYLPAELAGRTTENSVAPQTEAYRADFAWGQERFLDEARTLARFKHPNIIQVYRFLEAHGTAYIVMEYAEGETLAERLKRQGALGEDELKAILLPLLDGLAQVHAAGILHRDIKPANIMLRDADGSPVLVDFGSARQAIGERSRSMTAIVTPGYGPIEQYSSRGRQGPWTDLYALGGVCYRALTGNAPEEATERVRNDPQTPAVEAGSSKAAPAFLRALDWALQVNEDDRPQDAAAWRAALLGEEEAPTEKATAPAKSARQPWTQSQEAGPGAGANDFGSGNQHKGEAGGKATNMMFCPGCKSEMAQASKNCLKCGMPNPYADHIGCWIIGGIAILPIIFAWFTLRPGVSKSTRLLAFGWLAGQFISWLIGIASD